MTPERTLDALRRAQAGDPEAREALVRENMGLVRALAGRYVDRGCPMEDLVQIGAVGLYEAILRFDTERQVRFSTFAVPWILGEIRRHFRSDGLVRVSRSLKEIGRRAQAELERRETAGEGTTAEELAAALGTTAETLQLALESRRMPVSMEGDKEADGLSPAQTLAAQGDDFADLELRITLESLESRESAVIRLRYYSGCTQAQAAARLGLTQPQISRIEQRALGKLRLVMQE